MICLSSGLATETDVTLPDGSRITPLPTFAICTTFNPGYAGRTMLPDALKSLFRPVSMMVPDYCLISEVMLYSDGLVKAGDLARRLVTVFKLSSEQLSSQDHYDFGMRAVKSAITHAGITTIHTTIAYLPYYYLYTIINAGNPAIIIL